MAEKITFDDLRARLSFDALSLHGVSAPELLRALIDTAEANANWNAHLETDHWNDPHKTFPGSVAAQILSYRALRDLMEPKPCRHSWCCYRGEDGKQFAECPKRGCGARIDLPEVGE